MSDWSESSPPHGSDGCDELQLHSINSHSFQRYTPGGSVNCRKVPPPLLFDYRKDTEIQLVFPDQVIGHVISGGFKNQHQTQSSGGSYNLEKRIEIEDETSELKLPTDDAAANELRPKYAFVSLKHLVSGLNLTKPSMYGNVVAVLKEEVKDRATITDGDSLNIHDHFKPGIFKSKEELNLRPRPHSFDQRITAVPRLDGWQYIETQFWGALTLRDVQGFLVNCQHFNKVPPAAVTQLKQTGIPVHHCVDGQPAYKPKGSHTEYKSSLLQAGECFSRIDYCAVHQPSIGMAVFENIPRPHIPANFSGKPDYLWARFGFNAPTSQSPEKLE